MSLAYSVVFRVIIQNELSKCEMLTEFLKVHRTVATSSSTPLNGESENNNHKLSSMLEEYSHKTDEDCSKTKSIKKYRDELWKR